MAKNFNDFLNNLTPDKIGNQIGGISLKINLGLLEEYHKWLHQEDENPF